MTLQKCPRRHRASILGVRCTGKGHLEGSIRQFRIAVHTRRLEWSTRDTRALVGSSLIGSNDVALSVRIIWSELRHLPGIFA